jgi:hypothetical protein
MPLPFPDDSDQLPESYSGDLIRLLAQSPRMLYLYWRYAHDPSETLRQIFGERAATYHPVVRLVNLASGIDKIYRASPTHDHWFDVEPDRLYRADVGLLYEGAFHPKLSSNEARTPRPGFARPPGIAADPTKSAWDFARRLNEMGYVSYALEVFLEAADSIGHGESTRTIAREYSGISVPQLNNSELQELRALLVAIALESNYVNLRQDLSSKSLREWLIEIWFKASGPDDDLNAGRLREVFLKKLGIKIYLIELDPHAERAMLQGTGTALGGSCYVHMPGLPFSVWMPSMAFTPPSYSAFKLKIKSL